MSQRRSHRFMTILFTGSMCTIPFINSHTLLCRIFFIKEDGTNAKIFLNSLQSFVNTVKILRKFNEQI